MELIKVNEMVNRTFKGEVESEEVTSVSYNIVDNGTMIGSASISNNRINLNAQVSGTMDELKTKVEGWFTK